MDFKVCSLCGGSRGLSEDEDDSFPARPALRTCAWGFGKTIARSSNSLLMKPFHYPFPRRKIKR